MSNWTSDKPGEQNEALLPWTGERFIPEVDGNIALEHLHRYCMARELIAGKRVLDIASGEGYGSAILAEVADTVIGVDVSPEAVLHATRKYRKSNLEFRVGSCAEIPLRERSVDAVVSFETIEHHDQHTEMMQQIKRILRPEGVLIISSPDKFEYSDSPKYKNAFHVKELYRNEFESLLKQFFGNVVIFGQKVVYGSALFCEGTHETLYSYEWSGDKLSRFPGLNKPIYLVAVASDGPLPPLPSSFLGQEVRDSEPVKARDLRIDELRRALAEKSERLLLLQKMTGEDGADWASNGLFYIIRLIRRLKKRLKRI